MQHLLVLVVHNLILVQIQLLMVILLLVEVAALKVLQGLAVLAVLEQELMVEGHRNQAVLDCSRVLLLGDLVMTGQMGVSFIVPVEVLEVLPLQF
jgi:hypothetical protein